MWWVAAATGEAGGFAVKKESIPGVAAMVVLCLAAGELVAGLLVAGFMGLLVSAGWVIGAGLATAFGLSILSA